MPIASVRMILAANIGRRVPVDLGLVGDVGATIAALLPLLEVKRDGTASVGRRELSPTTGSGIAISFALVGHFC